MSDEKQYWADFNKAALKPDGQVAVEMFYIGDPGQFVFDMFMGVSAGSLETACLKAMLEWSMAAMQRWKNKKELPQCVSCEDDLEVPWQPEQLPQAFLAIFPRGNPAVPHRMTISGVCPACAKRPQKDVMRSAFRYMYGTDDITASEPTPW
jgi:hypothetical protein